MERIIFGHTIRLKSIGCNVVGRVGQPISPSVNLFVKVTKGCNAHCPFVVMWDAKIPHLHLTLIN